MQQVAIQLTIQIEPRAKDLPRKPHQADERLDHASREDGRPVPALSLRGGEYTRGGSLIARL